MLNPPTMKRIGHAFHYDESALNMDPFGGSEKLNFRWCENSRIITVANPYCWPVKGMDVFWKRYSMPTRKFK